MSPRVIPLLAGLAAPLAAQDGQQLYTLYCSACHGADGKGATGGTFPPLSESPWVGGEADRAIKIILKGLSGPVEVLGKTYNLEMPPQGGTLQDDQLAAILTYVRASWGNQSSAVTTEQVKAIREATKDRATAWTAEQILKLHPLPLEKTALTNLKSQAYSGTFGSLPDFSTLTASNVEEEHDGIISLKDSPFEDRFAILWQGEFNAPADGTYEFMLDADDEAAVFIGGNRIAEVRGAGPMNGSRVKKGKITLKNGPHPFRLEFVEFTDRQGVALAWRPAGEKRWRSLTDTKPGGQADMDPIVLAPSNGRAVIFRNFITGTTPRAIGVGFPGGVNLAWSADHMAPEMIWTGEFMDAAPRWIDRGTVNSPPSGDNLVRLTKSPVFPSTARFRGYKLDAAGNPTFAVQVGSQTLLDSWTPAANSLVRSITLNGGGSSLPLRLADGPLDHLEITAGGKPVSGNSVTLVPGQAITLTYQWK